MVFLLKRLLTKIGRMTSELRYIRAWRSTALPCAWNGASLASSIDLHVAHIAVFAIIVSRYVSFVNVCWNKSGDLNELYIFRHSTITARGWTTALVGGTTDTSSFFFYHSVFTCSVYLGSVYIIYWSIKNSWVKLILLLRILYIEDNFQSIRKILLHSVWIIHPMSILWERSLTLVQTHPHGSGDALIHSNLWTDWLSRGPRFQRTYYERTGNRQI